jgi:fructose-1,6-bisphosphatase/inositol monophosphatase family enzyme
MGSEIGQQEVDVLHCLAVATAAAQAAGAVIKAQWSSASKGIQEKSTVVDLVTETDKRCEAIIQELLSHAFPAHSFIGEESAAAAAAAAPGGGQPALTDAPTWMVS